MCLSTVYKGTEAAEGAKLAEYVTNIETLPDGTVRLLDITGEAREFKGRLARVDLIKNAAFLELA
ncbi:MAG: CooT family nickel-binding protein [Clostridiales Family XIII bacterium]|jgi:predicted RNA-binding protein|nr:CooT family nickel-binding protein [Clostridiales Family XIII bacterium]